MIFAFPILFWLIFKSIYDREDKFTEYCLKEILNTLRDIKEYEEKIKEKLER
jgi:hypothetical protein